MNQNPFIIILKQIWPTIYRIINGFIYFVINLIKSTVVYAIRQIKNI